MNIFFKISKLSFYILFIFNTTVMTASSYNVNTLEIFSKIIPRLVLMSSQKNKLTDSINICVVRDNFDDGYATLFIKKLEKNYIDGIKGYQLKFIQTNFNQLDSCKSSDLSFLFNSDESNINKAIKYFNEQKVLTTSYDSRFLKDGVGISIFIGKKVLPYINPKVLKKNNIEVDNILLRVSKIYREENE